MAKLTTMRLTIILLLLLPAGSAFCQVTEPINTDRPDQSDGVYTLPKNVFQLETGLIYGNASGNYFLHNTMLRYGLLPKTELRLEFNYGRQYKTTGIMPANISVKQALFTQNGIFPSITLVGNVSLPFLSTPKFRSDHIPAGLTFAFENELSRHFSLAYNAGAFLDGVHDALNWLWTTNLGYSPGKRWSLFLEYFGDFLLDSAPDHNLDAGVLFLLRNNLQLDAAVGTSLFRETTTDRFVTVGVSYRF